MNNNYKEKQLRNYLTPNIKRVILDNEISLQLESEPPVGPGETQNLHTPDYFNNDPYKSYKA